MLLLLLELKNGLTKQTAEDAVEQYKRDRDPRETLLQIGSFTNNTVSLFLEFNSEIPVRKKVYGEFGGEGSAANFGDRGGYGGPALLVG
jgi:hypothetical protein